MENPARTKLMGGPKKRPSDPSCLEELATLPDVALRWAGRPAPAVVDALSRTLVRALRVQSVRVRLCADATSEAVGSAESPLPNSRARRLVRMPIGKYGEWGTIMVATNRSDFPDREERALVNTLAGHALAALRYAQLAARQERSERLLAALTAEQDVIRRLGRRFVTLGDIDEVLAVSLEGVREVMHADFCEVYELSPDPRRLAARCESARTTRTHVGAHPPRCRYRYP